MHKRPGWFDLDLSLQRGLRGTSSIRQWTDVRLEARVHRLGIRAEERRSSVGPVTLLSNFHKLYDAYIR